MSDEIEVFLNKVDAFAKGLDETEQAMLAHLIRDEPDDDVAGFNFYEGWPSKIHDLAPRKLADMEGFLSSGHTSGNIKGITAPGDIAGVIRGGGGNSI